MQLSGYINLHAYGTHQGAEKAWDTRGRKPKPPQRGKKGYRFVPPPVTGPVRTQEDLEREMENVRNWIHQSRYSKTSPVETRTPAGSHAVEPMTDPVQDITGPYSRYKYTQLKTTGKSWTGHPHSAKGYFFQRAIRMDPHTAESSAVYGGPNASVIVHRTFKTLGAPHDRIWVREIEHDPDGWIIRTRTRKFTQIPAALRSLKNRYNIDNPWAP